MNADALIPAATYVRMSTEHQQYSTSNQLDTIVVYAERHGFVIVREFSDEGKSGLNIQGREGLTRMIEMVQSGLADFKAILVYDVSRWGRFQDADESAYYEYICRRAGIAIHYCAEQFENDGSLGSSIIKTMKRSMAGEYSRELSAKVFQGACRLIQLGYRQGGAAGYGLRRMLVDQAGVHKGELGRGEHKSIQTDRVILVPGPPHEVETVRWIYEAFVRQGKCEAEIASSLNERGIRTDLDREWTRATVHQILSNEKYIGNNVYHRTSCKLKQRSVSNPPDLWVRSDQAFEGIVEPGVFYMAQGIIVERSRSLSDEEMLTKLKSILERHGRLSGFLIDESDDMPSSAAFRHRFGSLVQAYRLIGYTPQVDYSFIEINRQLRRLHPEVVSTVLDNLREHGATVFVDQETDLLHVNGEFTTSLTIARCLQTPAGSLRWAIRLDESLRPDITIAVRMSADNATIKDYYLLPAIDMTWGRMRLAEDNGIFLDTYRFPDLRHFFRMAERCFLEDVA
jgi:DNA invertase Pin-like site-specific DNA recombinase